MVRVDYYAWSPDFVGDINPLESVTWKRGGRRARSYFGPFDQGTAVIPVLGNHEYFGNDCGAGRPDHGALSVVQLNEKYVSSQHAIVRWTGQHWELKDLGSRNGTFLNGNQLRGGHPIALDRGSIVAFGQLDQRWELTDDEPPRPMAIPILGGAPVLTDTEILAFPSADDPQVTIYPSADDNWTLERPEEGVTTLRHLSTFEVGNVSWQFSCPLIVSPTATCEQSNKIHTVGL